MQNKCGTWSPSFSGETEAKGNHVRILNPWTTWNSINIALMEIDCFTKFRSLCARGAICDARSVLGAGLLQGVTRNGVRIRNLCEIYAPWCIWEIKSDEQLDFFGCSWHEQKGDSVTVERQGCPEVMNVECMWSWVSWVKFWRCVGASLIQGYIKGENFRPLVCEAAQIMMMTGSQKDTWNTPPNAPLWIEMNQRK